MTDTERKPVTLSEREQEVLRCVARGATNQQIALELNITLSTVKVHLRNIFAKINVSSRTEASLYALRTDILPPEEPGKPDAAAEPTAEPQPVVADAPATAPAAALPTPSAEPEPAPLEAEAAFAPVPAAYPETDPLVSTDADSGAGAEPALPAPLPTPDLPARAAARQQRRWLVFGAVVLVLLLLGAAGAISWFALAQQPPTEATGTAWRASTTMQVPRTDFGLAGLGRTIYVIGGRTAAGVTGIVESYAITSDAWTLLAAKPTPVSDIQVVAIGGVLYVAGGTLESGNVSPAFERYDPARDQWASLPPLPEPRSQYAATAFQGKLYLFGGWDGAAYTDTVWIFDPDERRWTAGSPMPEPRGRMGIVLAEDRVHLIGGRDDEGILAVHQVYDPTQEGAGLRPWKRLAPLPEPAENLVMSIVIGDIYTFQANADRGLLYRLESDTWHSFDAMLPANTMTLQGNLFITDIHLFGTATQRDTISFFHQHRQFIYRSHLPMVPVD